MGDEAVELETWAASYHLKPCTLRPTVVATSTRRWPGVLRIYIYSPCPSPHNYPTTTSLPLPHAQLNHPAPITHQHTVVVAHPGPSHPTVPRERPTAHTRCPHTRSPRPTSPLPHLAEEAPCLSSELWLDACLAGIRQQAPVSSTSPVQVLHVVLAVVWSSVLAVVTTVSPPNAGSSIVSS